MANWYFCIGRRSRWYDGHACQRTPHGSIISAILMRRKLNGTSGSTRIANLFRVLEAIQRRSMNAFFRNTLIYFFRLNYFLHKLWSIEEIWTGDINIAPKKSTLFYANNTFCIFSSSRDCYFTANFHLHCTSLLDMGYYCLPHTFAFYNVYRYLLYMGKTINVLIMITDQLTFF